jgi:hypothetical protein
MALAVIFNEKSQAESLNAGPLTHSIVDIGLWPAFL